MARARFKVLDPGPLRNTERHTRVCCKSSKYWSTVFAMSDPHERIPSHCRHITGAVDEQVAILADPDTLPRKRLGRRALDFFPALFELAAVAWTRDDAQLLFPRREAAKVRAYSAEREVSFLRMNNVDTVVDVERDRVERV